MQEPTSSALNVSKKNKNSLCKSNNISEIFYYLDRVALNR